MHKFFQTLTWADLWIGKLTIKRPLKWSLTNVTFGRTREMKCAIKSHSCLIKGHCYTHTVIHMDCSWHVLSMRSSFPTCYSLKCSSTCFMFQRVPMSPIVQQVEPLLFDSYLHSFCTQECFTYVMAASILIGGNQAEYLHHPEDANRLFPHTAGEAPPMKLNLYSLAKLYVEFG